MQTIKVLVVDDSRLARRRFLAQPLAEAGYEVFEAVDGQDGFNAVQEHTPDIIISDLLMPVMDGFDFIAKLRENNASQPILVMSADIQETTRQKIQDLDVFEFLNKPFKRDEMLAAVSRAAESLVVKA